MKNKRVLGTILTLCFIMLLLVISTPSDSNSITGGVVSSLTGGSAGLFVLIVVIAILAMFIFEYDWVSSDKK